MTDDLRPPQPWVLLRKDKPVLRFEALSAARKFYDQLRYNGPKQPDAAIFGPGGEAWYCWGSKEGNWFRDDGRRKREADIEPVEPETAK